MPVRSDKTWSKLVSSLKIVMSNAKLVFDKNKTPTIKWPSINQLKAKKAKKLTGRTTKVILI